jgi:predicted dehydrogenase
VIRVALLGGGFMGATHAAAWSSLDGRARVSHVVSRSLEKAQRLAEPAGATAGTDPWAPLEDPGVDAVDICLPTPLHREATERALAAGKHVLLEKPIALTLEDADAIVTAAQRSDRVVMVGHVLRFFPAYAELRRRAASGELGALRALTAQRLSAAPDWAEWLTDPARSGGVAVDLMVHDFDQANLFLGPAQRAYARPAGGDDGGALAIVEHERGTAVFEASMTMPPSYPFSSLLRLAGDAGVAEYAFRAAPAEGGGNIGEPSLGAVRLFPRSGAPLELPVAADDPWALQAAAFADRIDGRSAAEHGTPEQARDALRVALAVRRSLSSGGPEAV